MCSSLLEHAATLMYVRTYSMGLAIEFHYEIQNALYVVKQSSPKRVEGS